MIGENEFDRLLASWLETDGPQDVPARLVDDALASARRQGQLGGWLDGLLGRHWPADPTDPRSPGWRRLVTIALVTVLTLALLGVGVLGGAAVLDRIRGVPAPTGLPAPSALPAPTATPAPTQVVAIATSTAPDASPGPMITPRSHAGVARLSDGRILVVGGVSNVAGADLDSAEIYDPATARFTFAGSLGTPREEPLVALLDDGRVLTAGGQDRDGALASAEIYDPTSGTFSATGPMPEIRDTCHCGVWALVLVHPRATTLADGRVLIAGGRTTGADIFDPASGTFRRSAPIPCDASRGPITTLADGRVLVICPATPSRGGQAALYDPATDTFSSTGAPRTSSAGAATLLLDGRVLLTGEGFLGTLLPAAAELYDPTSGTFTIVDDPLNPNADSSVVPLPDGRVLFLTPDNAPRSAVFDPATDHFTAVPSASTGGGVAVGLADGRVLVLPATSDQDLGPSFVDPADLP